MQGLITPLVGPSQQGQLQGALNSLRGITGMIGPGLFTQVFAFSISTQRDWQLPGVPFLLAALLLLTGFLPAWRSTQTP